jgi:hypothetical protein
MRNVAMWTGQSNHQAGFLWVKLWNERLWEWPNRAAAKPPRTMIRDSVEWIVWAVRGGSEGAPVEGRGARQDNPRQSGEGSTA